MANRVNDKKYSSGQIACDLNGLKALVLGGAVFGGGGGGTYQDGLDTIDMAIRMGDPKIITLNELKHSGYIATVSAVGAPAATDRYLKPIDFVNALDKLIQNTSIPIVGIISSEMGARASVNGVIQSAVLGLPVVDAPANGRAHPIGVMGGLGLHKNEGYLSLQAAYGGDPKKGRRIELLIRGELEKCGSMVREASIRAGGVVAVARNPVTVEYLKQNAAVGALAYAQALGKKYLTALETGENVAEILAKELGGEVFAEGRITELNMKTKNGLDVGFIKLNSGHSFTIWNEYITAELDGNRLYSFPDLITSIDAQSNLPINTCQLEECMAIKIIGVPKEKLILGETMKDKKLLNNIEKQLGVKLN